MTGQEICAAVQRNSLDSGVKDRGCRVEGNVRRRNESSLHFHVSESQACWGTGTRCESLNGVAT